VARRRRRDDLSVSLFPFLSVLACVIGTLTLLLAAIAVGSMGGQSIEQIQLSERYAAVEAFLSGAVAVLEELEAQLVRIEQEAEEDEDLGRRLFGLGLNAEISLEELTKIAAERERLEALRKRRAQAERRGRAIAAVLREKEQLVEANQRAQLGAPIIIDPSGLGREWRPYLVECTKDYVELLRTQGDWSYRIQADQLAHDADYVRYLRRLPAIHDSLLIFLIRADGIDTCNRAESIAKRYRVRTARLPLPGEGSLDLGLFNDS
jgi:hypothetical protein